MPLAADKLAQALAWVREQEGKPYLFGSKGDLRPTAGGNQVQCYDCSGFVTSFILAAGGPDWRQSHGSAGLVDELGPILIRPPHGPICIAVYGRPVDHVMLRTEDGRVVGASGAGASCTTVDEAMRLRACVHWKPVTTYRADFRGYLQLPEPLR